MIHAGSCIVNVPSCFSRATIVGSARHVRRSETCPIGAFALTTAFEKARVALCPMD